MTPSPSHPRRYAEKIIPRVTPKISYFTAHWLDTITNAPLPRLHRHFLFPVAHGRDTNHLSRRHITGLN
ncbi:hypothetical protein [[Limnothrix rosea] IAM M-220]|uniref:hypothetical protein n=1 Tax=[Limnothrix rosea] IAM M-220 TaxID=454133 RepID=UPI0011155813|nr:hypothetical protein [[Limnothrix rosea] IAM M-220]